MCSKRYQFKTIGTLQLNHIHADLDHCQQKILQESREQTNYFITPLSISLPMQWHLELTHKRLVNIFPDMCEAKRSMLVLSGLTFCLGGASRILWLIDLERFDMRISGQKVCSPLVKICFSIFIEPQALRVRFVANTLLTGAVCTDTDHCIGLLNYLVPPAASAGKFSLGKTVWSAIENDVCNSRASQSQTSNSSDMYVYFELDIRQVGTDYFALKIIKCWNAGARR